MNVCVHSWLFQDVSEFLNGSSVAGTKLQKFCLTFNLESEREGGKINYSGTQLNGHPSIVDTCDITDNSECLDYISIDFNIFKPPQQWTPRYSI